MISKNIISFLPLISLAISACNFNVNPKNKPNDWILSYWISDELKQENIDNSHIYVKSERSIEYLDANYSFLNNSDGTISLPKIMVLYYLQINNEAYIVTEISIIDPNITIYGLSMSSSQRKIKNTFQQMGFKYLDMYSGLEPCYSKDGCEFRISSTHISIFYPYMN